MSSKADKVAAMSSVQLALLSRQLRAKIEGIELVESEPIAIVGMGCRLPGGVDTPAAFWSLLAEGRDAVSEVSKERWDNDRLYDPDPAKPGKISSRWAGLLDMEHVAGFDPYFFGIAPREAANIDPQQRLVMEVAWEALEDAGIAPTGLAGTQTGVFIGSSNSDYLAMQLAHGDPSKLNPALGPGNAHSFLSGRLSYLLGLEGPSLTIDTACSSSLVAIHLACQSLRRAECSLAICGGVNVILSALGAVMISQQRVMAPDGRCKTFDARADGFVRAEGCGILALKRLSDALASGDAIHAVIRGTAVNQDGRSNGMTAPNALAQQAVIRQALENGGVTASQVTYVETHGTGTSLGDPIEVDALKEIYGQRREDGSRCALGAVKTNFGHADAAAGVAGLMKLVLSMKHGVIPRNLHLKQLNPNISIEGTPLFIPTDSTPWPIEGGRRLGAVSSFGLSGTNAHMVLESAPVLPELKRDPVRPLHLLALSAKTEDALGELATRYARYLREANDVPLEDICATAHKGRSHWAHRLAAVATSRDELAEKLSAIAEKRACEGTSKGQAPRDRAPKIAFLFTGQGSQRVGMGRELYETQPVFRDVLQRCDELLRPHLERPLLSVLYPKDGESSPIDDTAYTQPALFAFEVALATLHRSFGIEPSAVIGHSVGELAAACIAGVFSLEDGLVLAARRGALMQALPKNGQMAAVFTSEERVRAVIEKLGPGISISAVNGPEETVISGLAEPVTAALAALTEAGVKSRVLNVSHAFHSACMDPALDGIEKAFASVKLSPPQIPLVLNLTGDIASDEVTRAAYFRRQAREAVRFSAGIQKLHAEGYGLFLEIGPTPALSSIAQRCLPEGTGTWLASLRKGQPELPQLLQTLGALYVHGARVSFADYHQGFPHRRVRLPTYPFQRTRHWLEPAPLKGSGADARASAEDTRSNGEANLGSVYDTITKKFKTRDAFIRFAPFREVLPGFSHVVMLTSDPEESPFIGQVREAYEAMHRMLFRGIDMSRVSTVLDIGCGVGTDVITLAKRYSNLELHGCNISVDQIDQGRQRAREEGLTSRVKFFYQDSSRDPFPGRYDLAISFQVLHHIVAKRDALANVGASLNNGGFLVMAEILSSMETGIDHADSSAHFAPRSDWAAHLADASLRIVACVDTSREIANFLHDASYDDNFHRVTRNLDAAAKAHVHGPQMLAWLLRRKLTSYFLFTVQKDTHMDRDEILRINQEKLAAPIPYGRIVDAAANGKLPLNVPSEGRGDVVELTASTSNAEEGPVGLLGEKLRGCTPEERQPLVEQFVRGLLGSLLQIPNERLDLDERIMDLGIDSMMALEVKQRLDAELGVKFHAPDLLKSPTISELVTMLTTQVERDSVGGSLNDGRYEANDFEEGVI